MEKNKEQLKRKIQKKQNLKDAKSHFRFKWKNEKYSKNSIQNWFHENRYYSWKKKGLMADFYTMDYRTIYFASNEKLLHFVLSFS